MMQVFRLNRVAAIAVLVGTASLLGGPSAQAQGRPPAGERGFWCDTSSGVPTTMYQNSQGNVEPWIRWVSNQFTDRGYDPLTRCRQVTGRMETYRRNQQLRFITVGIMNGQRVVCTASQVNGRCEGLIFTLKPNQEAVRTLNTLLAWREGQAATPSLRESGSIPYIDVRGRLGSDEPSSPSRLPTQAPQVVPQPPQQQPQQPSSGGLREL